MNEKCSLSNLSRYLQVIGFLSLIIILIIVVYYYLQSNHSTILEKYEGYSRRDCVVYLKGDIADTEKCDATQGTSNYTDTCSYRFDGWSEFATYTDKDGKTIPYPKKIYTLTNTNSGSFTNPMFTNNCFKPNTSEEDGIPQEFEYNANNVVRYDEQGTSGNTAVGTNIFGGSRYSSMQFLNTANPTDNYNTLLDSICSASTKALGSLKDSVFYMFEFDGTTNKLANITSVALNDDQTTFSISSKYNVLTNLPPIITPLKDAYGIQYDTNAKALKIFKKNNIEKEVLVYKFNYMSYVCPQSQIKNYMRARRMITPDKFIKYGFATTPYYSKNIQISSDINTSNWSNFSNPNDFNRDYSVEIRSDLSTSKTAREDEIYESYADARRIAASEYTTAERNYNAASTARTNFSTNFNTFSSLIGIQKINSITKVFDYKSGYNTTSIDSFNISIPTGATATKVDSDVCIQFPYTTGSGVFTTYGIAIPAEGYICDVLVVGGGGSGGRSGGGGGAVLYSQNVFFPTGAYIIRVGNGAISSKTGSAVVVGIDGVDSEIVFSGTTIFRAKGGGGGGLNDNNAGRTGGSSGGGEFSSSVPSSLNIISTNTPSTLFTTSTNRSPNGSTIFGNRGGFGFVASTGNYMGGGGGGAGGAGGNGNNSASGAGGSGINNSITGTATMYGSGGSSGVFNQMFGTSLIVSGAVSSGGGSGAYNTNSSGAAVAAVAGTSGRGGGGGGWTTSGSTQYYAGDGGSGIVILRFKIKASYINNSLGNLTDNTSVVNDKITTTTTLSSNKSNIKANTLSSFIFLQRGTYKFRAGFEGQNNILYSELIIYEGSNSIVYSYDDNKAATEITIEVGKFYKLAFRYIYCNFSNSDVDLSFNIKCEKQNLDLTNYLFGGANIKANYANSTIMNLFSNVKYTGNSDTTYNLIKGYLDTINFFNINALEAIRVAKKNYRDYELPAIIAANYVSDTNIININRVINTIDRLKSNNNANNYSSISHLPTDARSLYKDATIDEIFGKNYERLVTKERVSNYSEISNTTTIRPKKIYVEAVA
jgi:hypothetical protein